MVKGTVDAPTVEATAGVVTRQHSQPGIHGGRRVEIEEEFHTKSDKKIMNRDFSLVKVRITGNGSNGATPNDLLLPDVPFFDVKSSKEDASAPADGSLGGNSGALSGNVIRKEVGEPEVNQLDVDVSILDVKTSDASPDAFDEIMSSVTGAGATLIMSSVIGAGAMPFIAPGSGSMTAHLILIEDSFVNVPELVSNSESSHEEQENVEEDLGSNVPRLVSSTEPSEDQEESCVRHA